MANASPSTPDRFNEFINATFRLNNALLTKRDNLVRDLGLTSARWQVLEAAQGDAPGATASGVARQLGLSRQGVQRIINDLEQLGMLRTHQNPHDKRGHLIALTEQGIAALFEAGRRQSDWSKAFNNPQAGGVGSEATELLRALELIAGGASSHRPEVPAGTPLPLTSKLVAAMPERPKPRAMRAFEGVQAHILDQIKLGHLVTESKLPAERELAASLGIGRSAVREALRSLEISGILRFERGANGGAFVRQSGPDGIASSIRAMLILGRLPLTDLLEIRASLLGQCARLGTERASAEDLDKLERNIDELEANIAEFDDQVHAIGPATDFYRLAARAAQNPLMVMLVDAMADLVAEMLASLPHRPRLDSVAARRDMVAAMRAGHGDEAERVIRMHTQDTNQLLLRYEETLNSPK